MKAIKSLTTNERLTIILSSLAFIVSVASVYFQFFYISTTVTLAKVDFDFITHKTTANLTTRFALINNGSRDVIILELAPEFDQIASKLQPSTKLPLILKPTEAQLVTLSGTLELSQQLIERTATKNAEPAIYLKSRVVAAGGYDKRSRTKIGKIFVENQEFNGYEWLLKPITLD